MNNQHHNNHFFDGFMLGLAIGAAAVFLLGTKSGKNLLKIISEQGIEGISNMMDEYNIGGKEEEDSEIKEDLKAAKNEVKKEVETVAEKVESVTPKKKFFRRFKK